MIGICSAFPDMGYDPDRIYSIYYATLVCINSDMYDHKSQENQWSFELDCNVNFAHFQPTQEIIFMNIDVANMKEFDILIITKTQEGEDLRGREITFAENVMLDSVIRDQCYIMFVEAKKAH